jgi:hypothetical protein
VSDDLQHIVPAEQYAATGRAMAADLACRQPSIDCPYIDATKPSDLSFRQKLLLAEVLRRRHQRSLLHFALIFINAPCRSVHLAT